VIYKDDLQRVYALIEDEKRWTQDVYARDKHDNPVDVFNRDLAVCWCLEGAFLHLGIRGNIDKELCVNVPSFNDSHTHSEVLALLKSAIERATVRPQS
jgi:hypothetical protein